MIHLYEVEVRNRVVKGTFKQTRIKGTQGGWYEETISILAKDQQEAEAIAKQKVKSRKIKGVSPRRRKQLKRVIEIQNVKEIA